jgi:hypothetical protein
MKYSTNLSADVQTGVILLVIYQLVTRYYGGMPVAYLPFEPPQFLRFITHRGLKAGDFRQVSVVRPQRAKATQDVPPSCCYTLRHGLLGKLPMHTGALLHLGLLESSSDGEQIQECSRFLKWFPHKCLNHVIRWFATLQNATKPNVHTVNKRKRSINFTRLLWYHVAQGWHCDEARCTLQGNRMQSEREPEVKQATQCLLAGFPVCLVPVQPPVPGEQGF